MHTVVKEDIHIQLILPGAHVDMLRGDLGELLHDPLGADAHVLGGNGGGDEDVGHLGQLLDELPRALDHGLVAVEIRIVKELENHVRAGVQRSPAIHLVNGDGGIEFVLLVGEPAGLGDALHQQIVNIQGGGHTKAFTHDRHLMYQNREIICFFSPSVNG